MRIPLGPFDLVKPLAKGGMGEVWAAEHRAQELEVAIKVITADYARHPGFVASLRHEVRAMATLSHPHIVRILDQGEVDGEAARASGYQIVEGSPYIAMEMVRGETLAAHVLKLPWEDVREILVKLLGALAHAHARRVLHRDLKPANLLLPEGGTTWQVKLTDFGIAHPLSAERREGPRVAGTPHFMAPEQRRGDWRKYRPATDLYAVGRMASALLARDEEGRAYVPPGFNDWMARILAATPQHRFAFAADAAWALKRLGDPTDVLDDYFDPGRPATTARTTQQGLNTYEFVKQEAEKDERPLCTTTFDQAERPPMPPSWRMPTPTPPTRQFKNAGAGLFGIRTIEIVGRVQERNHLWSLLHRVHREGRIHVALLRGPEGMGKGTLLRWLSERGYEVGASWPMHAAFSPVPGGASPMATMMANELNTLGLPHDEAAPLVKELAELFGTTAPGDIDALTELANPAGPKDASKFRFSNAEERLVALVRYLRWLAARRPVLVHLEEVQWGLEGIELVQKALELEGDEPLPMFFVLSVDDQSLATCPMERMALERLGSLAGDAFHDIELGPLPPTDQRALVASLLGLDPTLVARTAESTEGNPLHAVQQVARWLESGMLVEGANGLVQSGGEGVSTSVEDLWKHRLAAFLEDKPANDAIALELLAVLGHEVPRLDWARLTRRAGFQPSQWLVDGLVENGMLKVSQTGSYSFAHASLRQAVLDQAERAGRLQSHHQNCADLVKRYATGGDRDGRVGEHLLYGGRAQAALHYLFRGAEHAMQEGDASRVRELLVLWNRALDELGLPDNDSRHGDGLYLEGRAAQRAFQTDRAERLAERLRNRARAHDWPKHHARAQALLGKVALLKGEVREAQMLLGESAIEAEEARDPLTQAEALYDLAQLYTQQGEIQRAARKLAAARGLFVAARSLKGETQCLLSASVIARLEGRPDEALTLADAARQLAAQDGSRVRQADALTIAGEVHRMEGRPELAEKAYRIAMQILRSTQGPYRSIVCELNIAQLQQERGEHDAALDLIGSCIERLHKSGRRGHQAIAHTLMLPSLAHAKNRIGFERHLSAAQDLYTETGLTDEDACRALDTASKAARDNGWTREANQATLLYRRMKNVAASPPTLPPPV
ncbi:MAG: protein kinase [Alphaproteobacteria bacterium]|nr:protein kinase [Alphaproteobacteria bacterium]